MPVGLPIASFLCAALVLVPLPWHWRAGTVPTISIALWLFLDNLINGVNTIIWAGNVNMKAAVWCDISSKIFMGSNLGLPASIFSLCIHLERVSSVRQVSTSLAEKRRRQIFDCFICFGLPIIYMVLHYIVQGHRFDIVEDFGCRPTTYVSLAAIFIIWVPILLLSAASIVLSSMALHHFWVRRITFARHLATSALTPSRYFRLMALALFQMTWGLAVSLGDMFFTFRGGLRPWISWANVHSNFSRVGVFPTLFIDSADLAFTYALWWTIPISSIAFFLFFAFGQDAVREYRAFICWVLRRPTGESGSASASLPVYNNTKNAIILKNMPSPSSSVPPEYDDVASSRFSHLDSASSTKALCEDDAEIPQYIARAVPLPQFPASPLPLTPPRSTKHWSLP